MTAPHQGERYVTASELAGDFGIPVETILRLHAEGRGSRPANARDALRGGVSSERSRGGVGLREPACAAEERST
jgi:hypothetical protein